MALDTRVIIGIAALITFFVIYKLISAFSKKTSDYELELEKIMTSEDHKVKGRHE